MTAKEQDTQEAAVDARDVADLLARLLDKSLVIFEQGPGGGRYRLPELVREYGREVVMERGEGLAIRKRHRDYFTGTALQAERALSGPDQAGCLARLEIEHDNLRAALEQGLSEESDPDAAAASLAGAIWRFWYFHGYLAEGLRWLERILDRSDIPPDLRAKALNGAGALARESGNYEAAKAFHEESVNLFKSLGDERGLAAALGNMGNLALNQRDFGAAEALYRGSLALCRKMGDRQRAAYSLNNLGVVARHYGDTKTAWSLYEEALANHRELGNRQWESITLSNLGSLAQYEGRYEEAREFHTASLALKRDLGDRAGIAISLDAFASLIAAGELSEGGARERRAARLYGAAHAMRRATGAAMHTDDLSEWERDVGIVRSRLGDEAFEKEWTAGLSMPLDAALEAALER